MQHVFVVLQGTVQVPFVLGTVSGRHVQGLQPDIAWGKTEGKGAMLHNLENKIKS